MITKQKIIEEIKLLIEEGERVLETKYHFNANDNNSGVVFVSLYASGYKVDGNLFDGWISNISVLLSNVQLLEKTNIKFEEIKSKKEHSFNISEKVMNLLLSTLSAIEKDIIELPNEENIEATKNNKLYYIDEEQNYNTVDIDSDFTPRFENRHYQSILQTEEYPFFSLNRDTWNDYGTFCTFYFYYHPEKNVRLDVGMIKILQKCKEEMVDETNLPEFFNALDNNYISLGQGLDVYNKLVEYLDRDKAQKVMKALNDVALDREKAKDFEDKPFYSNALLRDGSAEESLKLGKFVLFGESFTIEKSFKYSVDIEEAEKPFDIDINFDEGDSIPGRIAAIIGKNAVGKTKTMSLLASDLVKIDFKSEENIAKRNERFYNNIPLFNKVITVSYSAFDSFEIPEDPQKSYYYAGLRDRYGKISQEALKESYKENIEIIHASGKTRTWLKCLGFILNEDEKQQIGGMNTEANKEMLAGYLSLLSSGQRILVQFVTSIIARIEKNSIILFDEPETHLHPNAIAIMFGILRELLVEYDSFAILATHSPIIIQEIPSKRVTVLERSNNITTSSLLKPESFGESISEITDMIFDTYTIKNLYKEELKVLSEWNTYEEVNLLFNNKLSFNARSYLLSLYGDEV
tara:strand:- start:884 stop:2785 length:1902 start_codon:yes stop_codon:yes gene_type:complete